MEEVPVVIVGAGPSGLAMALSLAKYRVKSIVLEKESEITNDPRAVYLNGDAVRILWDLGIREQLYDIGHASLSLNFHKTSFNVKPFYTVDTSKDDLQQALPMGVFQIQPRLEAALADLIDASQFCSLRRSCVVEDQEFQSDRMIVRYTDQDGNKQSLRCSWLVGADGKKGVVRKHFLEPSAGVKQVDGRVYSYEGTWVAANLKIDLTTPSTHPQLPFWELGMTPEQVYDLYWPKEWHFCTPPGKPTACGRFGPYADRFWRHEFAELEWNDSMNSETLLWEHITPMITRDRTEEGIRFPNGAVIFPRDCINIVRCRPFTFSHKVVNKWFDRRRILIGDSAHVFPPFGGEGMTSGIRDAHQLAWRLALVETTPSIDEPTVNRLLSAWEAERQRGIDNAAEFTKINGTLTNETESWAFYFYRHVESIWHSLPLLPAWPNPRTATEAKGFAGVDDGFFLPEYRGGGRLAQIFVESGEQNPYRSDELLRHNDSLLTLLVIGPDHASKSKEATALLQKAHLPPSVLSQESIIALNEEVGDTSASAVRFKSFRTTTPAEGGPGDAPNGYQERAYLDRLGASTVFAIIRPDFYIFALLKSSSDLEHALNKLRGMLNSSGSRPKL